MKICRKLTRGPVDENKTEQQRNWHEEKPWENCTKFQFTFLMF